MLVVGFGAGALQANCYLLATGDGEPCVIVDPGQEAEAPVAEAIREHRLSPVAALCTHGHFDHVFSGSIGRTDLPGGDPERMGETLRTKVLTLPDEAVVLPGHGPATTIGRERASNPFLQGVPAGDPAGGGSGRGL